MFKKKCKTLLLAPLFLGVSSAYAVPIVLDFEGLDNLESIGDFYNGGTSQNGNSGADFGIGFSSNTLALKDQDAGGDGNFGGEPSPDTAMFFLTGASAIMNVAAGFDTGFSFFYSAINNAGSVDVYDGLNGTGNILASLNIGITPSDGGDPTGAFSPFFDIGVGFLGTAMSVSFAGVQNQIAFDDITFGSVTAGDKGNGGTTTTDPINVPEPTTLALLGMGIAGIGFTRRKVKV